MPARDLPHQGETEAGAGRSACAADAMERLEHLCAVGLRDAGAMVADPKHRGGVAASHLDLDRRLAVTLGVLQQVAHHAPQQARIAAHHDGVAVERAVLVVGAFLGRERQQVDLLVDLEAAAALTFECAVATRGADDDETGRRLRRILVPLAKVRSTRAAIGAASQALEILGGNGYMEDWPMARQLRDAQCHTIWEGTENICCLDVRRAMRNDGAHEALLDRVERALAGASASPALGPAVDAVSATLVDARLAVAHLESVSNELQLLHTRRLTYLLSDLAQGALLLDEATWALGHDDARKAVVARRFAGQHLVTSRARGILDNDRTVLDLFEPLTRYGTIELAAAVAA